MRPRCKIGRCCTFHFDTVCSAYVLIEIIKSSSSLTVIAYSLIMSRILHALPVFGGFLSSELVAKIDAFFKRLKRFGYMTRIIPTAELTYDADHMLFKQVCLSNHC